MVTGIVVLLAVCLLASLLCSVLEGALYSVPPSRVEALRRKGGRSARVLAELRERIDEPMAAILTVNTVAQTVAAVAVGAHFARRGADAPSVAIAAALLTLALLFVAELVPKSIGVAYAEEIAPRSAVALRWLVRALWPIVRVELFVTSRVKRRPRASAPTAEDVVALSVSGARAGNLDVREVRWISNALRLSEVAVRQIMTPRTVVYALPAELPLAQVKARSEHWVHSRLPLFRERNPDEIVGLVTRRAVFDRIMAGDTSGTLESLARPVHSVPDSMTADNLLEWFVSNRQHLAIVRDELQAYVGIVTIEDVLETFVGAEIVDEHDPVPDMRELARKRAAERGVKPAVAPKPKSTAPA